VTDRGKFSSVGPASRGGDSGHDALAHELSELARDLHQADDPDDVLREVVQAAIELVPGTQAGSVTALVGGKRVEHKAASSPLPARIDAVMTEYGEGPCLDALLHQRWIVRVDDMRREVRWPRFAPRAAELGALSMLAFPMFVKDDCLCALNLYADAADAFTDESEHVGRLLAAHAAVAYSGAQREENLLAAIETRDLIGQAVGLLMERYMITSDRAFSTLVRFSRQSNRKLRDVATELIRDAEAGACGKSVPVEVEAHQDSGVPGQR
jgi:transcriptional regulator with GAF, ATPase, and Fis domain